MNPLASVVVASPPAAPSVAALVPYVESMMNQMITVAQQEVRSLVDIIAQEEAYLIQEVAPFFGIPTPANPTFGTVAHQTSSGSESGSGASPTHPIIPKQGDPKMGPSTPGSGIRFDTGPDYGGGGTATVTGQVWLDSNGDGFENNGEMGFSEIQVYLVNAGGTPVAGDITDEYGDYQMTISAGPVPANYTVHVVFPAYDLATKQDGDSQIDQYGNSTVFALAAGDQKAIKAGIRSMNVTILEDHPPGQPIQDQTTLRDAIQTGNNGPPQPAVTFIDPATKKNLNGTISLQSALDPIEKSYNIVGSGAGNLTVQGGGNANPFRIFTVNEVTSTISGLTIQNGFVQNDNGGGILNNGDLTLLNDDVYNTKRLVVFKAATAAASITPAVHN